ncbi:MAG: DEAD/DEAH box helicase [Saprospiraceae bacterium]|nr:DEAD/DEAH box helicase [Saprospiraceae bacterium]
MNSFQEANLKAEILTALEDMNFQKPTPIQSEVLALFREDIRDCIALAQTGTGKTAAFSLPILNSINPGDQSVKAIVLSPTRELALQIGNDVFDMSKHLSGVNNLVVYGGSSISQQIKDLRKGPQIVVGTPGRTKDLINRGKLKLEEVEWVVLDEADEMLSMGFKEDLEYILSQTPQDRTVLLFSATLPKEIRKIANKYLKSPLEITVGNRNEGAKNVTHKYFSVRRKDKYPALKRLLDMHPDIYSIVFCRTKRETNDIAARLSTDGYNSDTLNGDLTQSQRDLVMQKFRDKQVQILVATDVAARGLDVNDLTHVINYKLPDENEAYVHRSGRTGRAGKSGLSYIIIEPGEIGKVKQIEKSLGKTIEAATIPSGMDICKVQLRDFINKVKDTEDSTQELENLLPEINESLKDVSKDELIKKLVAHEINTLLDYYKDDIDINVEPGKARSSKEGRSRNRKSGVEYTRFFLNVGRRDKYQKKNLLELINKVLTVKGIDIGDIEILKSYSFIELEKGHEKMAISAFKNTRLKGRALSLEVANKRTDKPSRNRKFRKNSKRRR